MQMKCKQQLPVDNDEAYKICNDTVYVLHEFGSDTGGDLFSNVKVFRDVNQAVKCYNETLKAMREDDDWIAESLQDENNYEIYTLLLKDNSTVECIRVLHPQAPIEYNLMIQELDIDDD